MAMSKKMMGLLGVLVVVVVVAAAYFMGII